MQQRVGMRRTVSAIRASALLAASCGALLLAGCEDTPPPAPPVVHVEDTWRVVAWGAGVDQDPAIIAAIGTELARRHIAERIVPGEGHVQHILEVSITRARKIRGAHHAPPSWSYDADATIREGRDAALTIERKFSVASPAAEDGAAALATATADAIQNKPAAPTPDDAAPTKPARKAHAKPKPAADATPAPASSGTN